MKTLEELKFAYDTAAAQSGKWRALLSGWQAAITRADREIFELMSEPTDEVNARIIELQASIVLIKKRRAFYEDSGIKTEVSATLARTAEQYHAAARTAEKNRQNMIDMAAATAEVQATGRMPMAGAGSARAASRRAPVALPRHPND